MTIPHHFTPSRHLIFRVLSVAAVIWLEVAALPVSAATVVVTSNADSGAGSLRSAIATASGGDTIAFDSALSGDTIVLTSGDLILDQNLTIDGSGLANAVTISGNNASRVITVETNGNVLLINLILADGNGVSTINPSGQGGAILNKGVAALAGCAVISNSASFGGALRNQAVVTLTNCTLAGNSSPNEGAAYLGTSTASATFVHCTIATNNAGTRGGGIRLAGGAASAFNNLIAGNTVAGDTGDSDANLVGVLSGGTNLISTAPLLAPLGNYGGPTPTMPPLANSPAVDAAVGSTLTTDQRGIPRPADGNGDGLAVADMGAVEAGPIPPVVTTLPATGIGPNSATLNGTINPGNLPTMAWFQYGLTTNYGNIGSLYSLPATNSTLALASVVSSISGLAGTTWTARESNRSWGSLASSADGTKLVAGAAGGQLCTSTDSGVTWTARDNNRGWASIASSADGTKLVAGVDDGQLYTSTDSGVTWTARETIRSWSSVASSADGTKLVAGDYGGQLYTSTDSGVTWTARNTNRSWYSVASSADGTRLVAGAYADQLYTSTDSGVTWTARDSSREWFRVASSSDGTKLVAGIYTGGQLYTSTGAISDLSPGTTYHYQLVGLNSFGTVRGTDGTFTTLRLETISVSAPTGGGGTVSGSGTFAEGSTQTVTAIPNSGYSFDNWTENGSVVSTNASYAFTVSAGRNLEAHFTKDLTVSLFRVGLNFARPGRDTAALTTSITVTNLSALGGQPLTLKLGDAAIAFKFRANGKTLSGTNGGGTLTIKPRGSTTGILKFGGLTKGKWQAELAKYGLTNQTFRKPGIAVTVPIRIEVGGVSYAARVPASYTATANKNGLAKKQ